VSIKEVSDLKSRLEIAVHGIDSTTLKAVKEIQASLEIIRTGCYCGDEAVDTAGRQKKLTLISNALKRLASKTKSKNCDPNSEIYKKA